MSTTPKLPGKQRQPVSPAPEPVPIAKPPNPVLGTANPPDSGTPNADATVLVAPLPLSNPQVRLGAGLVWVALAILLIGIVVLSIIFTGTWSVGNVKGAIIPVVCAAALAGAGFCLKAAFNRLFPRL
jgi:hypothetical protein